MTKPKESLEDLRREIDAIDTRLHDLIMQRAALAGRISAAKGEASMASIRPAREAEIMRRLAARHSGEFPRAALARIWRELISAITRIQDKSHKIAVYAPGESQGFWDLARDHFGSSVPMTPYGSTRDVLAQVAGGRASIGILPCPTEQDAEPWWPSLCVPDGPRIVYRLPFASGSNARIDDHGAAEAFAVGRVPNEPTDRDRSLLVVETEEPVSRAGLSDMLRKAKLRPRFLSSHEDGIWMHLAEVDGFVAVDDPRLELLAVRDAVKRAMLIGSYALPLGNAVVRAIRGAAKSAEGASA